MMMNYQALTDNELVTQFEFSDDPIVRLLAERLRDSVADVEHAETLLAEANDDLEIAESVIHDFEISLDELMDKVKILAA